MLTAIHIYNVKGELLNLPFNDSSQYVIKGVDGLGPVKADIITSPYALMDGEVHQGTKMGMRNVVIQLGFNPSYESDDPFGELRRALYPWLLPKMLVEMHFLSNNFETVKLLGYVESFELSIFSAEPEVQISILCPDPHFSSLVPITVSRSGIGPLVIDNVGTINTGFILIINDYIASKTTKFELTRAAPFPYTMAFIGASLTSETEALALRIVTLKGSKSAKWKHQADYSINAPFGGSNVLGYVEGWLDLVPGINTIAMTFTMTIPYQISTASITFTPRYAGL